MPNCWYIHGPIVGEFLPLCIRQELQGRSAIFPPSSAPRHVLNCAWMDGECLACGDNGYLYMFQAFFWMSRNGGFLKWGYPKIIHFHRIFHCKPSIWGYHILWNPPNRDNLGIPMMRKHFFKLDSFTEPREQRPYDMDKSCCNFPHLLIHNYMGVNKSSKEMVYRDLPSKHIRHRWKKTNHCMICMFTRFFFGFLHHRHPC